MTSTAGVHIFAVLMCGLAVGCAATPDEIRQKCLAHESPQPSAALQVGNTLGSAFTMGIVGNVNANRMYADCSMILGDDELKASCPAYVVACEQYLAGRKAAAGSSRVTVNQVNH